MQPTQLAKEHAKDRKRKDSPATEHTHKSRASHSPKHSTDDSAQSPQTTQLAKEHGKNRKRKDSPATEHRHKSHTSHSKHSSSSKRRKPITDATTQATTDKPHSSHSNNPAHHDKHGNNSTEKSTTTTTTSRRGSKFDHSQLKERDRIRKQINAVKAEEAEAIQKRIREKAKEDLVKIERKKKLAELRALAANV